MKKIRYSKRGFTLTEILLVTGIIVLVSAAAFVGVAVTINRARDASDDARDHADNFELEARSWIETITPNKADFASQSYYEPESESSESETESETTETSAENSDVGPIATSTPTPTPTKKPTNTPTPTPKPTPTKKPTQAGGTTPNSGASMSSSSMKGSHVSSYSSNWGSGSCKITFDKDVDLSSASKIVVKITNVEHPGSVQVGNTTLQVNGDTTYVINNNSNSGWKDPQFNYTQNWDGSDSRNISVYFNFGNAEGQNYNHSFNIEVSTE